MIDRPATGTETPATTPLGIDGPRALPRGRVLRLTLRDNPAQDYFLYRPITSADDAPMLASVHGISRNAYEHACLFAEYCDAHGVVLVAPHFEVGRARDYQRLGRSGRGPRADAALDAILDEAASLTGAASDRIRMFGFSGGAQFAHRYTMAHPERVAAAVVAAAGWYTLPDPSERYPYGTRRSRELPDVAFDPEEFLRVPITVIVGERDTTTLDLRSNPHLNRHQGRTRVERARCWVRAMRAAARQYRLDPLVTLEVIPDGDHSYSNLMLTGGLGDRVFAALFALNDAPALARAHGWERGG